MHKYEVFIFELVNKTITIIMKSNKIIKKRERRIFL